METDIRTLHLDLECYSSADLSKCGVYKYVESPDFDILLFGYSINNGEVHVVDLAQGEKVPLDIIDALMDNSVIKWAFNAQFERVCLSAWLQSNYPERFYTTSQDMISPEPYDPADHYLGASSWRCSMVWSAYMGLPLSLAGVGAVLGLDKQKLTEGKDLVRYFCMPCKPTRANGSRTRNLWFHAPDKWAMFKSYNLRDVEAEMAIQERLKNHPVPETVWEEYVIDQKINDRGIQMDMQLVQQAIAMDSISRQALTKSMRDLTHLVNPNSVQQMKLWLADNGLEMESLGKKEVAAVIKTAPPELQRVLTLRQQLAKSSVRKYEAMQKAACKDARARGMFQFYGANRTGRAAGKLIQLQNLAQNHLADLDAARAVLKSGDYELMKMLYDDVPDTLSQLVRTAFVPRPGYKLIVADFSAIEARVLSFMAQEQWRMDVFAEGADIYCMSASRMFGVPVEKHGVNGHLRQKGKVAELACGYGGSVGALKAMGAIEMGLQETDLKPLVNAWREANPSIVDFWWAVGRVATDAVRGATTLTTHGLAFTCQDRILLISLPSGRRLSYAKPQIGISRFGGECITYEGIGRTRKWERLDTWGAKLVENIVQAVSRDILMYAMRTLQHCFIVGHVHDELIIECSREVSVEHICEQMARVPPWLDGIKLRADGYETMFYRKD